MKYLIALLLFVAGLAHADSAPVDAVAKMASQSEFYMNCGLCRVERGPSATKPLTIVFPPPVGVRYIQPADYNWLKDAGEKKAASGLYVMTERIVEACSANWSSDRCLAFRSMWRQAWPSGECIGVDGKVYRAHRQ